MTLPATASAEQLRKVFEEHGMCLLKGVLGEEECHMMETLWAEDLGQLLPAAVGREASDFKSVVSEVAKVRKEGVRAWPKKWDDALGCKGMASQRGAAHGAFAWAARLHPRVRRVFADLFGLEQDELCVGVDNMFWSSAQAPAALKNKEWLHVDQNHCTGMTWQCAQGVLYIWPSESEASSTTVVWPGSHNEVYDELMQDPTAQLASGQSVRYNQLTDKASAEALHARALAGSRRVPCPAGSLLLWDSRTTHQGWQGGPRLAAPVCWEPRERRDEQALRRKMWLCAAGVPSSHSAAEGRVHNMARSRPEPTPWSRDCPALGASITPFGVAPGREERWAAEQDALWSDRAGDAKRSCGRSGGRLAAELLREEVAAAL